jgi:hypothetical protein
MYGKYVLCYELGPLDAVSFNEMKVVLVIYKFSMKRAGGLETHFVEMPSTYVDAI